MKTIIGNENFNKWFRKSVVKKDGEPLIVYHGTIDDFSVFNTSSENRGFSGIGETAIGSHFTESKEIAQQYPFHNRYNKPRKVMELYLTIQKPKKYRSLKSLRNDMMEFCETNNLTLMPRFALQNAELFKKHLIEQGYDGITYLEGPPYNIRKNKERVWIAFYPWQIKSVTNNGNFDPSNYDINC